MSRGDEAGPNRTAPARPAATRERLLDAALAEFARRGVHDTRVEDVCATAGIARATFYRHFDGKAAVLLALHDQMADEMDRIAEALGPVTPDHDGRDTLRRWVGSMLAVCEHWAPVTAALTERGDPASELRRRSVAMAARFARRVGDRFTEGSVSDVDTAMAALAVIALVDGVGHQMRTWSVDLDRSEAVELLTLETLAMLHPGIDLGTLAAA